MQDIRTPPPRTTETVHHVRTRSGRLVSVIAALLTVLSALGALAATLTFRTEADIYWEFSGLVAVIAATVWLVAIILVRPSGRVVPAVASLLAVLIAVGIHGGLRDPGGVPVVIASVVVLVGCIATLLWNRAAAHRR